MYVCMYVCMYIYIYIYDYMYCLCTCTHLLPFRFELALLLQPFVLIASAGVCCPFPYHRTSCNTHVSLHADAQRHSDILPFQCVSVRTLVHATRVSMYERLAERC